MDLGAIRAEADALMTDLMKRIRRNRLARERRAAKRRADLDALLRRYEQR